MTRLGLILLGLSQIVACNKVTMVTSETPIHVQAQPPAPPLPDWPPIPQPPPPPRVILEGELLVLDEALTFGDDDKLAGGHEDILVEVARWLVNNPDVRVTVEVHSIGKGSRRTHEKRSKVMATQIVDALVGEGIEVERLVAARVGAAEDGQRHVALRVSKRADDSEMTIAPVAE